ncbi:hypothetical protein AMTRI_Chr09g37590 [Amborella trichopoda]|uniref:G-patch domain-containing protein n=1 Tax=Amborella trichopoda TaxID=13333 RepID=W1PJK3_AMBTC|nr:protein MOS2 [Amborella trichopoda]ERN08173.1 hypothetical protein AMTR_s00018p00151280 [Amborella trichopoda]|eukprot:XP_006846498.1 protein MOS2 [Amborella trichopoda]
MKLSFSLSSKRSSRPRPTDFGERNTNEEEPKAEFVTEFDSSKTPSEKSRLVIPRQESSWRAEKNMKNIKPEETHLEFEIITHETSIESDVGYGLNLRNKSNGGDSKRENEDMGNSGLSCMEPVEATEVDAKRKKDMGNSSFPSVKPKNLDSELEEDGGLDEFSDMPIEGFGAAVLAGYGWTEGQGIGRKAKKDIQVVQYIRRAGMGGLGFTPSSVPEKKQKKYVKPGESRESRPELIAPKGSNGRIRHAVGIDEKLVPREIKGFFVGKILRVIGGPHLGLKGQLIEIFGDDGSSQKIGLKLLKSEEMVVVDREELAELGSLEEDKCLKRMRELKLEGDGNRLKHLRRDERESHNGEFGKERKAEPLHGDVSRHDRERERSSSKREKEDRRKREKSRHQGRKSGERDGKSIREGVETAPLSWLRSHIRVKVVSKDFRGGRLYLKKGEVMDVVGPLTCDITMDDSKEVIQGVNQEILQTALPQRGGYVLVLLGKHKDVFGKLVEKDLDKGIGIVQDADTFEMVSVELDQIAEYTGDPGCIGY